MENDLGLDPEYLERHKRIQKAMLDLMEEFPGLDYDYQNHHDSDMYGVWQEPKYMSNDDLATVVRRALEALKMEPALEIEGFQEDEEYFYFHHHYPYMLK